MRKDGPVITDQGNFIVDVKFDNGIDQPGKLEKRLNTIPGVLDNGLFIGVATTILVGEIVDGQATVREIN